MRNSMRSRKNTYKILTASICTVILIVLMVTMSIKPGKLLGSMYNVNDLEKNIDKLKVGDIINYEINGQSKWKIIYIDKGSGTVDVVSTDTLGEITMTTKEDFENALDTLQAKADEYVDGSYAIKARSATRADLDNFGFEDEFWTADTYNLSLAYSGGKIDYIDPEKQNNNYYVIPYVQYYVGNGNGNNYEVGQIFNQTINGIDEWYVLGVNWESLYLMPKDPIKFDASDPNFIECPDCVYNEFINSFNVTDVWNAGNLMQNCAGSCCQESCINDNSTIREHYANNYGNIKVLRGYFGTGKGQGYKSVYLDFDRFREESRRLECCNGEDYKIYQPVTKGFRPVVTLKISNKGTNGKNTKDELKVGDYVKYNANEYQNWKVLSIDKNKKTVDIISGGVVKNLFLKGKDAFESYEDTLQAEVNKYKTSNAISARAVDYSDLANLNKIGDKVNAKYWINSKKQFNRKANDETSSPYTGEAYFNVGIMYYDNTNLSIEKRLVSLYIAPGTNNNNVFFLSSYNGYGELSFTAGIRPIITLKYDVVEKVDDKTKEDIINRTTKNDSVISKEQETNNYYNVTNYEIEEEDAEYNGSDNGNGSGSNKKGTVNNYYNDNSGNDKLTKWLLIGLIILNVSFIIQVILSSVIFKKIKKDDK